MGQDLRDEGAARARHVVHVLPADDVRVFDAVRSQVERLGEGEAAGVRLLVLVPSAGEGAACAAAVNEGLDASGALLVPITEMQRGARRLASGAPAIVVTPELARALVSKSLLKLDAVETLVLLQLDVLVDRFGSLVEGVMGELPKEVDRVATAATLTAGVEDFLERHARKARRMTYDLAEPADVATEYVVADAGRRTQALANILSSLDPEHATVIASEEDSEAACASLAQLGYGPEDALVSFSDGEVPENEPLVVLYTAPAEPGELADVVGAGAQRVVSLVQPEELSAFRRVFGKGTRPATIPSSTHSAADATATLRQNVKARLAEGGLHHHVLALAPLFAEYDAAEVAAAVLRLHEESIVHGAAKPLVASAPAAAAAPADAPRARRTAAPAAAAPASPSGSFASLFITIGEKDGARKGDLVGAISNEAGISSELLGKITMRDTFSVVEVDASVADRVIEALNGKTIRGRVATIRLDRGPASGGEDRPRRSGFGARSGGASRGSDDRPRRTFRERADDDRPRGRTGFGAGARGRPARDGERRGRPSRDDAGGPRTFREGDRGRNPRAMDESREWRERGERLRHTRRPRRED